MNDKDEINANRDTPALSPDTDRETIVAAFQSLDDVVPWDVRIKGATLVERIEYVKSLLREAREREASIVEAWHQWMLDPDDFKPVREAVEKSAEKVFGSCVDSTASSSDAKWSQYKKALNSLAVESHPHKEKE